MTNLTSNSSTREFLEFLVLVGGGIGLVYFFMNFDTRDDETFIILFVGFIVLVGLILAIISDCYPNQKSSPVDIKKDKVEISGEEEYQNCPLCMEKIRLHAKKCKHCGSMLDETSIIPEEERYSTFWKRGFANIIDIVLSYLVVPFIINIYLYFRSGKTIGCNLMGLRLVDGKGNVPNFFRLICRFFIKFVFIFLLIFTIQRSMRLYGRELQNGLSFDYLPNLLVDSLFLLFVIPWGGEKNKSLPDFVSGIVVENIKPYSNRVYVLLPLCLFAIVAFVFVNYILL